MEGGCGVWLGGRHAESIRFFAYPSEPEALGEQIEAAAAAVNQGAGKELMLTWPHMDIAGQFVKERILDSINARDVLVADVTRLNFNVTYEIGYAIGRGRPLLLTKNSGLASTSPEATEVGIFDTIGYVTYTNSTELAEQH